MLQPIGDYVNISLLLESEKVFIVEKEPLSFACIKKIPTDIETPLKENDSIVIMEQKLIQLQGEFFIHIDYIFLYQ